MSTIDTIITPKIGEGWQIQLATEFEKPYFIKLQRYLADENKQFVIYPNQADIFNAFVMTDFNNVKVVIIGQDPYHGMGQAHGLSFTVPKGVKLPPSLRNIYKAIQIDLGIQVANHGDLTAWAKQGVSLLNTTLTVRQGQPASHSNQGWEHFTDAAISALSNHRDHLVFMLWGNHAQNKETLIDSSKHLILKAPHPSPLSAHKGFLNCKHFSKTNDFLAKQGIEPIQWQLND
jgi:uracil-DNA glycosylase